MNVRRLAHFGGACGERSTGAGMGGRVFCPKHPALDKSTILLLVETCQSVVRQGFRVEGPCMVYHHALFHPLIDHQVFDILTASQRWIQYIKVSSFARRHCSGTLLSLYLLRLCSSCSQSFSSQLTKQHPRVLHRRLYSHVQTYSLSVTSGFSNLLLSGCSPYLPQLSQPLYVTAHQPLSAWFSSSSFPPPSITVPPRCTIRVYPPPLLPHDYTHLLHPPLLHTHSSLSLLLTRVTVRKCQVLWRKSLLLTLHTPPFKNNNKDNG